MRGNVAVPILAAVLGVVAIILFFEGVGGDGAEMIFAIAFFTLFNPLFWIVFLIVVLARRGGGQQQQQQIVVVTAPAGGGMRLRCPGCQAVNAGVARFCTQCGANLG